MKNIEKKEKIKIIEKQIYQNQDLHNKLNK